MLLSAEKYCTAFSIHLLERTDNLVDHMFGHSHTRGVTVCEHADGIMYTKVTILM